MGGHLNFVRSYVMIFLSIKFNFNLFGEVCWLVPGMFQIVNFTVDYKKHLYLDFVFSRQTAESGAAISPFFFYRKLKCLVLEMVGNQFVRP